ncbi:hypothetical protein QR680_012877 [Steinernema hermaphroditum]|uniref:EH domain-containing protein n=1 Tax=Steinernema hermaphroditum TaxID=289476 RepID=A0AA39I3L5_9BILA|nr:hypothetical protein QR680_012877 [Steinernema hermaphroditum]
MNFLKLGKSSSGGTQNANFSGSISPFGGKGIVGGHGGVLPPALLDEQRVPKFYQDAILSCGALSPSQLPNTTLVYNLMMTSSLSREQLGSIWSLVNRTRPGQLTRSEFFSCLALIALAQKGQSISALSNMKSLPIPHLQTCLPNGGSSTAAAVPVAPQNCIASSIPDKIAVKTLPMQYSNSKGKPKSETTSKNTDKEASLINLSASVTSSNSTNGLNMRASTSAVPVTFSFSVDLVSIDFSATSVALESSTPTVPPDSRNDAVEKKSSTPPVVDIYAAFKEVSSSGAPSQESEELIAWNKCLTEASRLVAESLKRWEENPAASMEVASTEKGWNHLAAVHEAVMMTARVASALKERGKKDPVVDRIFRDWDQIRKITDFHPHGPTDSTATNDAHAEDRKCGICLESLCSTSNSIEFIGRTYHPQCANFWINRIDSLLPQLRCS